MMAGLPQYPPYPAEGPVRSTCWLQFYDRRQTCRAYRKDWTPSRPAAEPKQQNAVIAPDMLETTPTQGNG